jgi:hypothetical protein
VNYGAYFIIKNYHYFNQFVKIGRKLRLSKLRFYKGNESYGIWNKRFFMHIFQFLKLMILISKFKKHYETFKEKCETISQAQALKSDSFLWSLYNKKTSTFLKELNIKESYDYYLNQFLHSILSPPPNKFNAFFFLQWALCWITPSYEFNFLKDKMIKGFKKDIIIDTVTRIIKKKDFYEIKTKKKIFYAKNVVVATPLQVSKRLLHLKATNKPINTHMFHVSGRIRQPYKFSELNLFPQDYPIYVIARQADGTFLIHSKGEKLKFKDYFSEYKIIAHKSWDQAFHVIGDFLWGCEQDKNLYLIGDHNITNLEDAYITGLYASNRILGKAK